MYRQHEDVKEFKNGNISIRFPREKMHDLLNGYISALEILGDTLDEIDCYFVGEDFCISNYDTGINIYNCHSDKIYTLNFTDVQNILATGKWLKLYARDLDEIDREIIEEY